MFAQIRDAALHYFEKKTPAQIRAGTDDSVRVKDLRHMLTSMGEKLTRDEMDELLKELPVYYYSIFINHLFSVSTNAFSLRNIMDNIEMKSNQ